MASSGCPSRLSLGVALAGCALAVGCGEPVVPPPPAVALTSELDPAVALASEPDPGVALPAGAGREILLSDCLGCHDLGGLDLFKGFYRREQWRDLVRTMVTHGARVDAADVEVLVDYLALNFGPP